MNEVRGTQRTPMRRRTIVTGTNRFEVDLTKKPKDMHYKWLRVSLAGMEDPENQTIAELNGWSPVPADRHPELAGLSAKKGQAIVRGGQMLVELPIEYAKESDEIQQFEAKHTLEEQIQRFGLAAKRDGGRGISRSKEALPGEIVE